MQESNNVAMASKHEISEQGFLYKTVIGVLDNSAFLKLDVTTS